MDVKEEGNDKEEESKEVKGEGEKGNL